MSVAKLQVWKLAPSFRSKIEFQHADHSFPSHYTGSRRVQEFAKAVIVLYEKLYIEILQILVQLLAI